VASQEPDYKLLNPFAKESKPKVKVDFIASAHLAFWLCRPLQLFKFTRFRFHF